jgi:hypothetical protein
MQRVQTSVVEAAPAVERAPSSPPHWPPKETRSTRWLAETHSARFELCRHFLLRFFDSELVSSPGQWKVVASGAVAILFSLSIIYIPAYYHKYLALHTLDDPEPYRLAVIADVLFVVSLAMLVLGLFTTLEWPELFPGLRDYLALAALPLRMRDVFVAKFTALLGLAVLVTLAFTFPLSIILPMLMSGGVGKIPIQVPAIFVSSSLAGMLVFLSLVALQGVLLNIVPVRWFPRLSLVIQGVLLSVFLCSVPLVLSVPSLYRAMSLRPAWAVYVPPLWFLGLDQVIAGNREPLAIQLARLSLLSVVAAAASTLAAYAWSYRRHRARVLESPDLAGRIWPSAGGRVSAFAERLVAGPRRMAVFGFIAKSLARSRQHRLVLTAFAAIALAVIFEGFVSLALDRGMEGLRVRSTGLDQAVIAIPLALSLFLLAGLRYLFRLPVELRANWIFRIHEPGHGAELLGGLDAFLYYCAAVPVAVMTLPIEIHWLGVRAGVLAGLFSMLASFVVIELMLFAFERIPFTSSYFPGKRPLIDTVMLYVLTATGYIGGLSMMVRLSLPSAGGSVAVAALLLATWWRARRARLDWRPIGRLEFEELPDPGVQTLGIEKD